MITAVDEVGEIGSIGLLFGYIISALECELFLYAERVVFTLQNFVEFFKTLRIT